MQLKLIPLYAKRSERWATSHASFYHLWEHFWMSLRQALFLAFGFGSERLIIVAFLHITGLISAGKLAHVLAHWVHAHTGSTVGSMFSSLWLGMPLSQGGFSFSA